MFGKLEEVEKRYEQIQASLMEPGVANNQERFRTLMKEVSDLEKVVAPFREYKKVKNDLEGNKQILGSENDPELREMAKEEIGGLEKQLAELEDGLKILFICCSTLQMSNRMKPACSPLNCFALTRTLPPQKGGVWKVCRLPKVMPVASKKSSLRLLVKKSIRF